MVIQVPIAVVFSIIVFTTWIVIIKYKNVTKIFPEGWVQFLLILLFSLAWIPIIYQYLDCGILANGFARVKCKGCGHEYLLAFSCKRRHFCPSCHAKRVVGFEEWLCSNVLKSVPHRHFVFSIPKMIRIYFLFDRKLLADLARIAWEVLSLYYKNSVNKKNVMPAAAASIQTFGDFLGFNPHLHILACDGCIIFLRKG